MEQYYITTPDKLESIFENGILADESGAILLSWAGVANPDNRECIMFANFFATDRLLSDEYLIFYVEPEGITGVKGPDVVGDFVSSLLEVVYQDRIEPRYLFYHGRHPVDHQAVDRFFNNPSLPYDQAALDEVMQRDFDWPDEYDQTEMRWVIHRDRTT